MPEEVFGRNQLFQRVIDTTITCRTIVKYNSTLSDEQRADVLQEIEKTLALLSDRESELSLAAPGPQQPDDWPAGAPDEEAEALSEQENWRLSLRHLHRLYQSYLSKKPGRGIAVLETRYRAVMRALDRVQEQTRGEHAGAPPAEIDTERLLGRVRGFTTALYSMFREFALVLSHIVDGRAIDVDTEALELLPESSLAPVRQQLRDITPLIAVFSKHLRLQEHRGALVDCARETSAFLVFLEENLGQTLARRKEVVAQIKVLTGLFNELTELLSDYEQAVGSIIQSPSTSR
jgi:hypothetical protein